MRKLKALEMSRKMQALRMRCPLLSPLLTSHPDLSIRYSLSKVFILLKLFLSDYLFPGKAPCHRVRSSNGPLTQWPSPLCNQLINVAPSTPSPSRALIYCPLTLRATFNLNKGSQSLFMTSIKLVV